MSNIAYRPVEGRSTPGTRVAFFRTRWPTAAAYVAFVISVVFTAAVVFGAFQ